VAERDRLQPWKPVAAAGTACAGRQVVADQLAAAAGEIGRPRPRTECERQTLTSWTRPPSSGMFPPHLPSCQHELLAEALADPFAAEPWRRPPA
jgi:hypothetical protein